MAYRYLENCVTKGQKNADGNGLKPTVARFLCDRCEDLRHDREKERIEQAEGRFLGSSIGEGQIPYNMQMDIDRLCLENAMLRFLDSGAAQDAFDVYYCYLEMFVGSYGSTKRMVEMLSEFETNGSSLLMKHRDHYSHSVYVFALGLAIYTAGSQEAFVELMNKKLAQLGLSESAHFTNCVGIYDENHYCTAYDLAVIMEAAMQNQICREILSSRTYVTSKTEEHPDGIELSNWFLRRIEDKDTGGMTMYGKTGYVDQSGSCAVSAGIGADGREYICVIANSQNKWYCITDHAGLYKRFSGS